MATATLRELVSPLPWLPTSERWPSCGDGHDDLIAVWNRVSRKALEQGNADDLHAARDDYRSILLGSLKILDGTLTVCDCLANGDPRTRATEAVSATRDRLQTHYDSLFPRWQTLEDLEGLLVEQATPTNDRLKELARRSRPPQSWYNEPTPNLAGTGDSA